MTLHGFNHCLVIRYLGVVNLHEPIQIIGNLVKTIFTDQETYTFDLVMQACLLN